MDGEEIIRILVDGIRDYAIVMLDPTGRIVSWNTGAVSVYGKQADEMLGRHFSCLYSPEDTALAMPDARLALALSTGRFEEEGLRVRKGTDLFWASSVFNPIHHKSTLLRGFAMVTRDISERKQAEAMTRLFADQDANVLIVVNSHGLIIQAGLSTEKFFGYSQVELSGQPLQQLVPRLEGIDHSGQHHELFEDTSNTRTRLDVIGRHKNGTDFSVTVKVRPIHSHDGLLNSGWIVSIAEQKQFDAAACRNLAELAHVNRLASIGEMFSKLSHETNQSLAAASNYARTCVRSAEVATGVTQEQLLEWMRKTAILTERASEIVNRVGRFLRKQCPAQSQFNINDLIAHVIAFPARLVPSPDSGTPTPVTLELDQRLPPIFADRILIEQVLINLLRNAVEAMEGMDDFHRKLLVRSEEVNGLVQVSVCDNGYGITPEHQAELFRPFFTTKANGQGLGLSISRTIIETHRGHLFVKSKPGSGTTVLLQLPIARREDTSCSPS